MAESNSYYFPARTLALTNYLTNHGFKIDKVRDSLENPEYKTFFFIRTPELEESVSAYLKSIGKRPDAK